MQATEKAKKDTKLDTLIEAAKRIRTEVGADEFAVVFDAYVRLTFGLAKASLRPE